MTRRPRSTSPVRKETPARSTHVSGGVRRASARAPREGASADKARIDLENRLRASEANLVRSQALSHCGTWTLDPVTRETTASDQLLHILEMPGEATSPGAWKRLIHPEDRPRVVDALATAVRDRAGCDIEHRLQFQDGSVKWVHTACEAIVSDSGALLLYGATQDITGRRRIEAALRDSEERFFSVFRSASVLLTISTLDEGRYLDVNQEFVRVSGFSREEAIGRTSVDLGWLSAVDRARLFERVQSNGRFEATELTLRAKDGRSVVCLYSGEVVTIGGRRCILSTALDVTERVAAATRLQEAHDRLLTLLNGLNALVYVADMDTYEVLFVNREMEEVFGRVTGQLCWTTLQSDRQGPCEFCSNKHLLDEDRKPTGVYQYEFQNTRNGHWYDVRDRAVTWIDGRTVRLEVATDITARKRADLALRRSEAQLREAQRVAGVGSWEWHVVTGTVSWSEGLYQILRLDPSLSPPGFDGLPRYYAPESWDRLSAAVEAALRTGSPYELDLQGFRADGSPIWTAARGEALRDEAGAIVGLRGTVLDVTARKESERRLREVLDQLEHRVAEAVERALAGERALLQQARFAAMGEMIGHIAHQWRQPLNALGMLIANVRDGWRAQCLTDARVEEFSALGYRLIRQMSTTISDFSDFLRPDKEVVPFAVRRQVEDAVALVAASFQHDGVVVEVEGDENIFARGLPNEYVQVLLNLLSNAKDAVLHARVEAPRVRIRIVAERDRCLVTISDNGGGITVEPLDRVFEPYFTMKSGGTGLGLYISKMILEKSMGGSISVTNNHEGAEFTIATPLAEVSRAG